MIASLPMYDWPEVSTATDAWWSGIARHLGVQLHLNRPVDFTQDWSSSNLLFSQTCGYPLTHAFRDVLRLVATPCYGVDGMRGAYYQSILFARSKAPLPSFRGSVAAVNTPDSMSGMLALKLVFAQFAKGGMFFSSARLTGGHLASLAAVRTGSADICAIDPVCVALAKRYRPDSLNGLVEVGRGPFVPGLPYVTQLSTVKRLRQALLAALADPELVEVRNALFLVGQEPLSSSDYAMIPALEREMEARGGLFLPL